MVWISLLSLLGVVALSASRVVALAIALKDVPSAERADVLVGLAECFRWWQRKP